MRTKLPAVVLALTAIAYLFMGHLDWWPGNGVWGRPRGFEITRPWLTGGDEPFYMMMVHSLRDDGDIRLDDEYESVRRGGVQAGNSIAGFDIEGHSILVNPVTGKSIKCFVKCTPAEIAFVGEPTSAHFKVSAHPAAYPALMALLTLPFRPSPREVDPLVGTFSIVFAIVGLVLTFVAARRSGFSERAALGAMLLVGFASPWLVYMRSYFTEIPIGICFLLGFIAMRRDRPILAGMAVGVAAAMKPVFVLFGVAWILERLWARNFRAALLLAASVGLCGAALVAVNLCTIHVPIASGAIPVSAAHDLSSLWDTFYEREHGLFVFVPWTVPALFWGLSASRRRGSPEGGLLSVDARRQIMLPYLLCLAVYAAISYGPSWCYGPRYYVPFMPFFALLAVDWVMAERKAVARGLLAVVVAFSAFVAITSAPGYHWLFGQSVFASVRGPAP